MKSNVEVEKGDTQTKPIKPYIMKKGILIFLEIFFMVSIIEAKNKNDLTASKRDHYSYQNAVQFIEDGIEFLVFTNGDFDYNANYNRNAPFNNSLFKGSDAFIIRDYKGNIRRIGTVFMKYNFEGNVLKTGNISIKYYRNKLTNVGHLNIVYTHWGTPVFYGNVRTHFYNDNGVSASLNIGTVCNYKDACFSRNGFR